MEDLQKILGAVAEKLVNDAASVNTEDARDWKSLTPFEQTMVKEQLLPIVNATLKAKKDLDTAAEVAKLNDLFNA